VAGYMAVVVINHAIIQSISRLAEVIHPKIDSDADIPQDCFREDVKLMLAIH